MADDIAACPSCNEDGMVCIPCAQYEALRAAAQDLMWCEKHLDGPSLSIATVRRNIKRNAIALRAAGILEDRSNG